MSAHGPADVKSPKRGASLGALPGGTHPARRRSLVTENEFAPGPSLGNACEGTPNDERVGRHRHPTRGVRKAL